MVKNYVATNNTGKMNATALRGLIVSGLCGDDDGHTGVTAANCAAFIECAKQKCNEWIATHPRLTALFVGDRKGRNSRTIDALTESKRSKYTGKVSAHGGAVAADADDDSSEHIVAV